MTNELDAQRDINVVQEYGLDAPRALTADEADMSARYAALQAARFPDGSRGVREYRNGRPMTQGEYDAEQDAREGR